MPLNSIFGMPQAVSPAEQKCVQILPDSYPDVDGQNIAVNQGFYTPSTEVVNDDAALVGRVFAETPDGIFVTDKLTCYDYLFALGRAGDPKSFRPLDRRLLPAHLDPETSYEDCPRFRFDRVPVRALPYPDRYSRYPGLAGVYAKGDTAVTMVNRRQAQALAQLLGVPEIAEKRFGLSGAYYADLPSEEQWGLLAMQGELEYMTLSGQLEDHDGKALRAFGLNQIAKPRSYPRLRNGIYPNTTWNYVKEPGHLRGASWHSRRSMGQLAINYHRLYPVDWYTEEGTLNFGLRVLFSART